VRLVEERMNGGAVRDERSPLKLAIDYVFYCKSAQMLIAWRGTAPVEAQSGDACSCTVKASKCPSIESFVPCRTSPQTSHRLNLPSKKKSSYCYSQQKLQWWPFFFQFLFDCSQLAGEESRVEYLGLR
jgi:hypothetical protein